MLVVGAGMSFGQTASRTARIHNLMGWLKIKGKSDGDYWLALKKDAGRPAAGKKSVLTA
jgi:hypothetical protein